MVVSFLGVDCKRTVLEVLSAGIPSGLGIQYSPERELHLLLLGAWRQCQPQATLNDQVEDFPAQMCSMNSRPKQY